MSEIISADVRPSLPPVGVGFGIYVHWPFCAAKCPYCDFNSHVSKGEINQVRFLAAYKAELAYWAGEMEALTPSYRPEITSIFFGGGTPSLMSQELVAGILEAIASYFKFAPDIEITLEANPQSVDASNFRALQGAGINRLSLGVQSFIDEDLKWLGRLHNADEARAAIETARDVFDRFSFDMMYGRSGQLVTDWRSELSQAFDYEPSHLSLYQLTIEPNTPYKKLYDAGKLDLPDEDVSCDFYELTGELCAAAGLEAYEISNYAVAGQEARHNILYWRYGDFLGIGPGAHGRLALAPYKLATLTVAQPDEWLQLCETQGHGVIQKEVISAVSLARYGKSQRYSASNLTQRDGFAGVDGLFRLTSNGLSERRFAILEVQKFSNKIIQPAPQRFGAAHF